MMVHFDDEMAGGQMAGGDEAAAPAPAEEAAPEAPAEGGEQAAA